MKIIPIGVVAIVYLIALVGTMAYVPFVTGHRLDVSKEEIEEWKAGIRRKGLRSYFADGVICSLLYILAELFALLAVEQVSLFTYQLVIPVFLGITNLQVSSRRVSILALESEIPLIPKYKIAFGLLGAINLVTAVVCFLLLYVSL